MLLLHHSLPSAWSMVEASFFFKFRLLFYIGNNIQDEAVVFFL